MVSQMSSSDEIPADKKFVFVMLIVALTLQGIIMTRNTSVWVTSLIAVGGVGLALLTLMKYKLLYVVIKSLPRDLRGGWRFSRVLATIRWADKNNYTVAKLFEMNANKNPNKICYYFEDEKWSFQRVQERSNQIGNYFSSRGFSKGDVVALFMENRPEYVCTWLGLNKIGVVTALVNNYLRLEPLLHSFEIVKAKAVIFGNEMSPALHELMEMENFLSTIPLYSSGQGKQSILDGTIDLEEELTNVSTSIPKELSSMKLQDSLLYIYTSGTTGLPKAAVIKQYRFMMVTNGVHFMNKIRENDIVYNPLPLYHMTGGMIGVGQALLFGNSVVIRKKFSASQFWQDCIKYNVTVAQYLGESCRYLLAQEKHESERQHNVRLMFGNGLRHEIWEEFTTRFNIKEIGEVYGSTEGNCNVASVDSKVGSVGFVPRILYPFLPMTLMKVNETTGEPMRDPKTGLIIKCQPNEPGELVGKIIKEHPIRDFQGYTDDDSTGKKILHDVFQKGDMAFRTNDVLMMDDFGYIYFKDRTGDTYRWKGENVSTTEVEGIIINYCSFNDVAVYGVKVPNTEGRVGMAAIADAENKLDLNSLSIGISKSLPPYAIPLFLRVSDKIDTTGTFKMKKMDLKKDGYDITKIKDKIYFFRNGSYSLLDEDTYQKINKGLIRL